MPMLNEKLVLSLTESEDEPNIDEELVDEIAKDIEQQNSVKKEGTTAVLPPATTTLARSNGVGSQPGAFRVPGSGNNTHIIANDSVVLEASLVSEPQPTNTVEVEAAVREKIIRESVQAQAVKVKTQHQQKKMMMWICAAIVVVMVLIVGVTVGMVLRGGGDSNEDESDGNVSLDQDDDQRSTLEIVRDRGYVKCGLQETALGFSSPNSETGILEGMGVELVSSLKGTREIC